MEKAGFKARTSIPAVFNTEPEYAMYAEDAGRPTNAAREHVERKSEASINTLAHFAGMDPDMAHSLYDSIAPSILSCQPHLRSAEQYLAEIHANAHYI